MMKKLVLLFAISLIASMSYSETVTTHQIEVEQNDPWTDNIGEDYDDGTPQDVTRYYISSVGDDVGTSADGSIPLLIAAHGKNGSASDFSNKYLSATYPYFYEFADDANSVEDRIILFVQGAPTNVAETEFAWATLLYDNGASYETAFYPPSQHMQYLEDVVNDALNNVNWGTKIDPDRIYMVGSSQGGSLTCEFFKYDNTLAAMASVNSANTQSFSRTFTNTGSVGVMMINHVWDATVDYGRSRMSWDIILDKFNILDNDRDTNIDRSLVDTQTNFYYFEEVCDESDISGTPVWVLPPTWDLVFITNQQRSFTTGEDYHDWPYTGTHGIDFITTIWPFLKDYELGQN